MYLKNQTIKISQRYAITEKLKERILGLDANEISEETNKELAHQIEHKLEEQLTAYHTSMKTQAWIPNSWIKKAGCSSMLLKSQLWRGSLGLTDSQSSLTHEFHVLPK